MSVRRLGYMPQLDGLRAFAVGLVIVGHASRGRFHGPAAGVEIFFALSGFLITTLLVEEHRDTGRIRIGAFYMRRALRLLPALGLAILFALVLYRFSLPLSRHHLGWAIVGAVLYANNWLISEGVIHVSSLLGHTWSLAEEEQFYFVWPTLLWFALRRWSLPRILLITAAVTCVLALLRPLLFLLEHGSDRVVYGSDTRGFGLMLGSTTALAYATAHRRTLARVVSPGWVPTIALLVTLLVWWRVNDRTGVGVVFGNTAVDIGGTLMVAHLVTRPELAWGRTLSWSPVVWAGQRSYGMYLFHYPILLVLLHQASNLAWPALVVATAGLTIVCAALSYRFVEQPVRGRGRVPVTAPVDPDADPISSVSTTGLASTAD
jgi:peptidoglycan/LPS O-acetylase OafA/YrhL